MAPAPLEAVTRAARSCPVTTSLVAAVLLLNLLVELDLFSARTFVLQSHFSRLYPWCLVTYVVVAPSWTLLYVPAYVGVLARWGIAAEGALGSEDYALHALCTTVVTAVCVVLLDKVLLFPVGCVTGGTTVLTASRWKNLDDDVYKIDVPYMYWGLWPVAQSTIMALCRVRGLTGLAGPSVAGRRLTLQHLPLALVLSAAVLDVIMWFTTYHPRYTSYRGRVRVSGFNCIVAAIALLVAWRYERHTCGPDSAGPSLDAFFYPANVRAVVRRAGEATSMALRPTRLAFLLPPREGGGGRGGADMPMPVFAGAATPAVAAALAAARGGAGGEGASLLPGTTAEEAERYRLIAREALARRLQEHRVEAADPVGTGAEAIGAAPEAAVGVEAEADDKTA